VSPGPGLAEDDRVECMVDGSWKGERGTITHVSEHGDFGVRMDDKNLTLNQTHPHERWRWDRSNSWPLAYFHASELRKLNLLEVMAEAANAPDD
jgi:hypothetical protein